MRFLITGHTGFKGSWLTLLLTSLGHEVWGLALDPDDPSLFLKAGVGSALVGDSRVDIRDAHAVAAVVAAARADVVVHLAAQPLVRESYRDPRGTVTTNVIGTMNVIDAARSIDSTRAVLVITTDKVYRNAGLPIRFSEGDPLGGHDPYSASKAMADLLAQSWASSFTGPPMGIARAGNVIGGGDFGAERLLPDAIACFTRGDVLRLRNPAAVRPWQHVLDCLVGYLAAVRHLLAPPESTGANAWNFGPPAASLVPVAEVTELACRAWGPGAAWEVHADSVLREEPYLALDSTRAEDELGWRNLLGLEECLGWTIDWYKRVEMGGSPRALTEAQISAFLERSPVVLS